MFFSADDYLCYHELWQDYGGRFGVRLRGYCLMPNHVHMVPVPSRHLLPSVAKAMVDRCYLFYYIIRRPSQERHDC